MNTEAILSKPDVYFGAADRQMEDFVDEEMFKSALVYGIFFHGDLVVPDIYLYINRYFSDLALRSVDGARFVRECLRSGAIIPAFRSANNYTFRSNLEELREAKIQGILPEADALREFLESAIVGVRQHYKIWSREPFSVGFRKTVERTLLSDVATGTEPDLAEFLSDTSRLRQQILQASRSDELGGWRRNEVNGQIAAALSGSVVDVPDVRAIWREIKDPKQVSLTRRLIKWVSYCYHFNQGEMLGLHPSLSALDGLDSQFVRHLARLSDEGAESALRSRAYRLPTIDAILATPSDKLFAVRNGNAGAYYFHFLAKWQKSPSVVSANNLLEALEEYTARLSECYLEYGNSNFNWQAKLRALIPIAPSLWGEVAKTAVGEAIGSLLPGWGFSSLVGKFSAATYHWNPFDVRDKWHDLFGVNDNVTIEAEPKVARVLNSNQIGDASFQ